jgi:hypothetical protein
MVNIIIIITLFINYVIYTGTDDNTLPHSSSVEFSDTLRAVGISVSIIFIY